MKVVAVPMCVGGAIVYVMPVADVIDLVPL